MAEPVPFKRPIRWHDLRASDAQKVIRERTKDTSKIVITDHAFDRVEERSITREDVYVILEKGHVEGEPKKNEKNEWQVIVTKRMAGTREAGVVTVVCREDCLIVRTVQWMDYVR